MPTRKSERLAVIWTDTRRAFMLVFALSACAQFEGGSGPVVRSKADESPPPLGTEIAWLGDLHEPESVKYDSEQDVFFISNMVGYGSNGRFRPGL